LKNHSNFLNFLLFKFSVDFYSLLYLRVILQKRFTSLWRTTKFHMLWLTTLH
jgi:hypothetical protein